MRYFAIVTLLLCTSCAMVGELAERDELCEPTCYAGCDLLCEEIESGQAPVKSSPVPAATDWVAFWQSYKAKTPVRCEAAVAVDALLGALGFDLGPFPVDGMVDAHLPVEGLLSWLDTELDEDGVLTEAEHLEAVGYALELLSVQLRARDKRAAIYLVRLGGALRAAAFAHGEDWGPGRSRPRTGGGGGTGVSMPG